MLRRHHQQWKNFSLSFCSPNVCSPPTECLKALGRMELAAQSYSKVVEMAPQHLEARLSLATLQQQLGRPDRALKALESMYDSETLAQDSSAAQKAGRLRFRFRHLHVHDN